MNSRFLRIVAMIITLSLVMILSASIASADCSHDYEFKSNTDNVATLVCKKCGTEKQVATPSNFTVYLKDLDDPESYYSTNLRRIDWHHKFSYKIDYSFDSTNLELSKDFKVVAEFPDKCVVDTVNQTISFNAPGGYSVYFSPKYDPDNILDKIVSGTKPLESVSVGCEIQTKREDGTYSFDATDTVYQGQDINIAVKPNGGRGEIYYSITVDGPEHKELETKSEYIFTSLVDWYPSIPGIYTIKATAYDIDDDYKTVESDAITVTVNAPKDTDDQLPNGNNESSEDNMDSEIPDYSEEYVTSFDLKEADPFKIENKVWTGKALKPEILLKYKGNVLIKDIDYTVKYSNNKNVGKAKVTITGKGNYTGTLTKTFKIVPKKPTIKNPKAAKKAITVNWKALKTKMSKSCITGYQVQIARNNKFTKGKESIKVKGYKKTSYKFTKLKAKTKYYVRVRAYMTVKGKTYYSKWSSVKNIKTR